MSAKNTGSIRLRGVRQNNLKNLDLDLPRGKLIVVTGLSGTGKSSLVFETLHAEGQRRYVETFSPYTRQFLELLDRPDVDSIENIPPSIAIEQSNTVKTSRSTVGTMTELCDYFKVWFSHAAELFDPDTGEKIEDDTPAAIWKKARARFSGETVLVAFPLGKPASIGWEEVFENLLRQGYRRVVFNGALEKIDLFRERSASLQTGKEAAGSLHVIQDRVPLKPVNRKRFLESAETALHFGQGELELLDGEGRGLARFAAGLRSPATGRKFREPVPSLFSFNSPLGACPRCRGFGRIIEIDHRLAIPDPTLTLAQGAVKPWQGQVYGESQKDMLRFARKAGIPVDVPFDDLSEKHRTLILHGEPDYGNDGRDWPDAWYGLKGFFDYLETKTYKMHVRVFLSRYRSYNRCPDCGGARLQPESLCWRWKGRTLPALYQLPISELLDRLRKHRRPAGNRQADTAFDAILGRLGYLAQVGLGYLTLDRTSRTLSGGEVERVNLTSCLGTSLVDTLFVLDEPSIGLHSRDIDRLIGILRRLTGLGNTVVVVEHDEAMIRAADHVLELGPEPGHQGGRLVFQGGRDALLASAESLTGAYLSGRRQIAPPEARRPVSPPPKAKRSRGSKAWLHFHGASRHNIRNLDFSLPLHRLVGLSGVSGSGKSTLLDNVIYQGLLAAKGRTADDPAEFAKIEGADRIDEVVLVDQSPVSRTPRSNPALYTGAWEGIREVFARTDAAAAHGFTASSFSFNAGQGRCDHCQGLGYERVEMQFLSDLYVPCPVCEGKRFKEEILSVTFRDKSIEEVLRMTVDEAVPFFGEHRKIRPGLERLREVGLGYLTLGQPLNTLSGGESQRLKLVKYLSALKGRQDKSPAGGTAGSLLLLDEPTTGLHRHDIKRLIAVLQALVEQGHSLVVIEHQLDVLKSADWLVEVGPGAGEGGGKLVAQGTPEKLAATPCPSREFLAAALKGREDDALLAAEPASADYVPAETPNGPALRLSGAREHNLKNLSLEIPHRNLTVVTGVSGSGKSTLAFDIVFAEGQRRFMESMSAYARQFVEQLPRPDIDAMEGIPPTVAIEQRVTRGNRKSTVATVTEVAQYLRLLYARIGIQHNPATGRPVISQSPDALLARLRKLLREPRHRKERHLYLCAPLVRGRKGHHQPVATWIGEHGYELMRADGKLMRVGDFRRLDRYREHDIEVVVADVGAAGKGRRPAGARSLTQALPEALRLGKGSCFLLHPNGTIPAWLSTSRTDPVTGESFPELDPKHFSFNSSRGWCDTCRGYGRLYSDLLDDEADDETFEDGALCPDCSGERLNPVSRSVKLYFRGSPFRSLPELLQLRAGELIQALRDLDLDRRGQLIVRDMLPQIEERLRFLGEVGLDYLSLDRPAQTLSGGEAQRIRLAAQLGSNLCGVLYVLDEPSIGLHPRDNRRLLRSLDSLRNKGNTLLVVEHDEETMRAADGIIDLGPGAGIHGGELLAHETLERLAKNKNSLTGRYLRQPAVHPLWGAWRELPPLPGPGRRLAGGDWLVLKNPTLRNLKGDELRLPIGRLIMACGVSGAGKSTLLRDLLRPLVRHAAKNGLSRMKPADFPGANDPSGVPSDTGTRGSSGNRNGRAPFAELINGDRFRKVIEVDQDPIGKTPRSTPATYLGAFDVIRQVYASLPEAKIRGHQPGAFSFNTKGGRCETCKGAGRIKLEMNFLPDSYLPCEACGGSRYGKDLLDIEWNGKSIADVLAMTFEEAAVHFDFHTRIRTICQLMVDTGLGYLTLGQSSPTLSGGEAQRMKLVTELIKGATSGVPPRRDAGKGNLYILEEPTIGLHFSDCEKLIHVLHRLVNQGHTVVVIEHNTDLLAEADYLIEIGPEGGEAGGSLLYQGPSRGLLKCKGSPTRPFLRDKLAGRQ